MTKPRLIYLPFGGAGEIGMNMYVYGYGPQDREQFIVVDTGVLFPDMETAPGVDLIIPDFSWLVERKSRVEAIFITHGHLDHLGAISFVTGELDVPVYAREFSRQIALDRIDEYGGNQNRFHTVDIYPDKITAGPFEVSYVPISHSIPESSSLIIDTPDGRIIHTGDFKLDHEPVIGEPFEEELWEE
ncbi:MAG: ribonuclease J, partial [Paracoccaceae bacterium]|nr:ribonuclease J [Paracoccaceae bacterium]